VVVDFSVSNQRLGDGGPEQCQLEPACRLVISAGRTPRRSVTCAEAAYCGISVNQILPLISP
jgi:hypothetical protein